MKHLIGLIALAALASAKAEPCLVGAHLASWHIKPGFESATYGVYARSCSGLTTGVLRNSEGGTSAYLAQTWSTADRRWSVTVGGITGYRSATVSPLVVPSYAMPLSARSALRLSFLPQSTRGGSAALHVSLEFQP
ncbi:MAG: hypothetical protein EOP37_03185 [Rubrivivax sp.]|nr:MAG: hypothetical protein EOP37_03185 [Rubrivivax sp.]